MNSTPRSPAISGRWPKRRFEHADTVMPGFTHLQPAQPVTLGHHLLAYVEMAGRDRGRFADARARLNESPLGAGALAGTSFPIDRDDDREGAWFRAADGKFARRRRRPRFRAGDLVGLRDRGGTPVALRRGDRDLVVAAHRPDPAVGQIHHRLVDDAAEAQSRRRRTRSRQDRPHRRRADRAPSGDQGPAARVSERFARGQGRRDRCDRRARLVVARHDRHGRAISSPRLRG